MSGPSFDANGMIDMSAFTATDPDDAVSEDGLAQLRHALVAAPLPELGDETWREFLDHPQIGPPADRQDELLTDPPIHYGIDVDGLLPPHPEHEDGITHHVDSADPHSFDAFHPAATHEPQPVEPQHVPVTEHDHGDSNPGVHDPGLA